jgi:hydroxyacylglutathione hydrolase
MKISDRVYLVGSGKFGMEISNSLDCNVYLLDGGSECALIDAGGGVDPDRIANNVKQSGFFMDQVKYLLLTHIHGDHAAGAYHFHKNYGIKVVMAGEAAPWLEQGDMDKTSMNHAIRGGVYPQDFQFSACQVYQGVEEGDRIRVGDLELRVLNTPGHSNGHVSYLWEAEEGKRSLFAGDTIFAGGKVVIQYVWDCIIEEYAKTVKKLHELNVDRLYPGHGPFLLSNASKHIEKAHGYFCRLEIPPNL